jgi:hypothetical protein
MQQIRIIHLTGGSDFSSSPVITICGFAGSTGTNIGGLSGSQFANVSGFGGSTGTNIVAFGSSQTTNVSGFDVSTGTNIGGLSGSQFANVSGFGGSTSISVSSGSEVANISTLQFGTGALPLPAMSDAPSFFLTQTPAWAGTSNSISDGIITEPNSIFSLEPSQYAFRFVDNFSVHTNIHRSAYIAISHTLATMASSEDEELYIEQDVAVAANLAAQELSENNFTPPEISRHGPGSAVFSWSIGHRSLYVTITPRKRYVLATDDEGVLFKTTFNPKDVNLISLFSERNAFQR